MFKEGEKIEINLSGSDGLAMSMRILRKYWTLLFTRLLGVEWVWSYQIPWAAVDGRRLLINPDGLKRILAMPNAVGILAFVLAHEALHLCMLHVLRFLKLSDKDLANKAGDYVVNAMIMRRNKAIGKTVFVPLDGILLDEKLSGDKSVEIVYRELSKQTDPDEQPEPEPEQPDGDEDQADGSEQGEGDEQGDDTEQGEGDEQGDEQGAGQGDDTEQGDGAGEPGEGEGEGEGDGEGEGEGEGAPSEGAPGDASGDGAGEPSLDTFPGMSNSRDLVVPELAPDEALEDVMEECEQATEAAMANDQLNRAAGFGSTCAERDALDRAREQSPLDWETEVRDFAATVTRSGFESPFSMTTYVSSGMVCNGRGSRRKRKLVVAIDISASMDRGKTELLLDCLQDLLDSTVPVEIHLLAIDTEITRRWELVNGDQVPGNIPCGGGTSFDPAFDYALTYVPDAAGIIYLTDGWASDPAYPGIQTLWLTYARPAEDFPTWGGDSRAIDIVE